jgi:S1-C subfamily serine protease
VSAPPPPPVIFMPPPPPPPPPPTVVPVLPVAQPPLPPPPFNGGNTTPNNGGNTAPNNGGNTTPNNGKLGQDDKDKVKHATVFLKITMSDGSKASGSGFFGCPESPNLLLTNAHVVGMLSSDSVRPKKIEVVMNSGDVDLEDEGQAQVLGVDRSSDLAVLELFPGTKKQKPLPMPITVKSAERLSELTELVVFGFPLGESLGKEITIRPTTVSSLRKIPNTNILDRIQVNGGMDPGNSGGPVVDASGGVVGVAVSGIPGRMINFAIPGERVHTILNGRIAEFGTGQPYILPEKTIGVPVTVVLIDPRNLVKDVALEVWTGKPGAERGASWKAPDAVEGDGPRKRFPLTVNGHERKGEIVLQDVPLGEVYWIQPLFTNGAGETQWVSAHVYQVSSQPVERKPADLVFRPQAGFHKDLTLTHDQVFKVGDSEDSAVGKSKTKAVFDSKCEGTNAQGTTVTLQYVKVERTNYEKVDDKGTPDDFKPFPSPLLAKIGNSYKLIRAVQSYDPTGNLKSMPLDRQSEASIPAQGQKLLASLHQPLTEALSSVSVPLPNKNGVAPHESWKSSRNVPIETPDKVMIATYNLTYTYVGQRKRDGRDEAVIAIAGELQNVDGKSVKVASTLTGTALVDLATGEVIMAKTSTTMEQQVTFTPPQGPVTLQARITTETRADYSKPKQ